jgi:hypothetical protein
MLGTPLRQQAELIILLTIESEWQYSPRVKFEKI